ncbi:TPA: hypothetical protein HA278_03085 [Candidatus Woesearchaeota archaeon]|nr:hypothetical protein [archaeon]HIJ11019.1 hypothetical protein [Candidatus Woesearchaeota archaeon]
MGIADKFKDEFLDKLPEGTTVRVTRTREYGESTDVPCIGVDLGSFIPAEERPGYDARREGGDHFYRGMVVKYSVSGDDVKPLA